MKKLLLTCATRAFAMRITQLLSDKFELVLATSDEVPTVFKNRYTQIPKGVNLTYAHEVLKVALDLSCDYVLPLGLDEIQTLSRSKILFEEYGIHVLCPGMEELVELSVLENPTKELALSLFIGGQDVLNSNSEDYCYEGLGLLSDSGESFILAVAK
ncbi:hypothetical protein [Sphingobacterium paucimobilis]|uniref:Uncharacterized protein n=1 Tax=Sphingobacterium paucimobilis HER1398 TaxID=1346330 RepID=U2J6J2_9SPHI|nr:hypothetical protein [Sphingobacterium paucimobilis]ERJ58273.1 hypothetical protein M472_05800 [Sphingobacterium paucimobilis HER1398]